MWIAATLNIFSKPRSSANIASLTAVCIFPMVISLSSFFFPGGVLNAGPCVVAFNRESNLMTIRTGVSPIIAINV